MHPDEFESDEDFRAAYRRLSPDQRAELKATLKKENQVRADALTSPHSHAAETLGKLFDLESDALANNLEASAAVINGGSLVGIEGTLATQATTLNALFHRLTQLATERPRAAEEFASWFKLALRAQAQSAKTLEILGKLKQGPKIVITRQLNAANQQVVHNGPELPRPAKGLASSAGSDPKPRRRALSHQSSPVPDLLASTAQPTKKYATLD